MTVKLDLNHVIRDDYILQNPHQSPQAHTYLNSYPHHQAPPVPHHHHHPHHLHSEPYPVLPNSHRTHVPTDSSTATTPVGAVVPAGSSDVSNNVEDDNAPDPRPRICRFPYILIVIAVLIILFTLIIGAVLYLRCKYISFFIPLIQFETSYHVHANI